MNDKSADGRQAEIEQVDVRFYDIIYNLLHDVQAAMEGMLEPIIEERVLGQAEVRQVFSVSKIGTVAGCMVVDGKVERNALGRVKRGGRVVIEIAPGLEQYTGSDANGITSSDYASWEGSYFFPAAGEPEIEVAGGNATAG